MIVMDIKGKLSLSFMDSVRNLETKYGINVLFN